VRLERMNVQRSRLKIACFKSFSNKKLGLKLATLIEHSVKDEPHKMVHFDRWARFTRVRKIWSGHNDLDNMHSLITIAGYHDVNIKQAFIRNMEMKYKLLPGTNLTESCKKQPFVRQPEYHERHSPQPSESCTSSFLQGYLYAKFEIFTLPSGVPSFNMWMIGNRYAQGVDIITGAPLTSTHKQHHIIGHHMSHPQSISVDSIRDDITVANTPITLEDTGPYWDNDNEDSDDDSDGD